MSKNKKKKYKVYPIELLYLLIISIVVFMSPFLFDLAKDFFFPSSLEMKKVIEIDIDNASLNKQGFLIGDKLMVQSGEVLNCFDKNGNELWKRTLKSSDTKILKWADKYIIADLDVGRLALVNEENTIDKEFALKSKVSDITVSKDNIYMLVDNENTVLILDKNLEKQGEIKHEHGDILKIACDFESSELILYTSSIENYELKTFCIVYNNMGKIVASLDLDKALIYDIFVEDNIIMISDEKFLVFNRAIRPISELSYIGNLTDVDFKNSKLYSIRTASEGNISEKELTVYNLALKKINSIKLAETSSKVSVGEKYLLSASENRITLMNSDLKILQEINVSTNIQEIKWMSEYTFYVVGDEKLTIYSSK